MRLIGKLLDQRPNQENSKQPLEVKMELKKKKQSFCYEWLFSLKLDHIQKCWSHLHKAQYSWRFFRHLSLGYLIQLEQHLIKISSSREADPNSQALCEAKIWSKANKSFTTLNSRRHIPAKFAPLRCVIELCISTGVIGRYFSVQYHQTLTKINW